MITFPDAYQAAECAARLKRLGLWPYARHAIRQIDGDSHHVVLLIGERIATRQDLDPA